jgi:hypothetical protein
MYAPPIFCLPGAPLPLPLLLLLLPQAAGGRLVRAAAVPAAIQADAHGGGVRSLLPGKW